MTEAQAIKIIEDFLTKHNYIPIRVNPNKLKSKGKSPDFIVKKGKSISFYCEVKTPDLKPHEITKMFHWTTTVSKIRGFIHKAVKQFEGVDPSHKKPWIIFFISSHMQLNWTNYNHAIQGKIIFGKDVIKDLENFVKDTDKDVIRIDLTLWCQVNAEKLRIHQFVPFLNTGSHLYSDTNEIYELLLPSIDENIVDANTRKYE